MGITEDMGIQKINTLFICLPITEIKSTRVYRKYKNTLFIYLPITETKNILFLSA